jgi:hypothetical protein
VPLAWKSLDDVRIQHNKTIFKIGLKERIFSQIIEYSICVPFYLFLPILAHHSKPKLCPYQLIFSCLGAPHLCAYPRSAVALYPSPPPALSPVAPPPILNLAYHTKYSLRLIRWIPSEKQRTFPLSWLPFFACAMPPLNIPNPQNKLPTLYHCSFYVGVVNYCLLYKCNTPYNDIHILYYYVLDEE